MKQRIYKGSDIHMLTACDVIADHALENLIALESVNPAWSEAYFKEIKERIVALLRDVFGIRSVKTLKEATAELVALQVELLDHLTMLRKQIVAAWRDDTVSQKNILDDLGYSAYWHKAKTNKSQTALIAMLEVFEKGCTPALLDKFAARKISGVSVDFVRNNLHRLFGLNVTQEGKKDSRKLVTADIIDKFNMVYNDTMLYAGSAQTLFRNDPVRRKEFTYSHVVKQLGESTNGKPGNSSSTPV